MAELGPGEPRTPRPRRKQTAADVRHWEAISKREHPPGYTLIGSERVVPGLYILRGGTPVRWVDKERAARDAMRNAAIEAHWANRPRL